MDGPPLPAQRFLLPLVGVLLECLDENQNALVPSVRGSGFLRREEGKLFLYTTWHLVSGFDPNDIRVKPELPRRRYLKASFQAAEIRQEGVEAIGGLKTTVLPLYDKSRPRWLQDDRHIPHPDLNAIGLHVPFWHDVVKLEMPIDIRVADLQVVDENRILKRGEGLVGPGEKCLVVGYPFGFSALGPEQPTPIILTRFVANFQTAGRRSELLLESIAAPTMSGGPVFVERDNLFLFGIYTGSIYPDGPRPPGEKFTDLGMVCNLSMIFSGNLPLVAAPSQIHTE